MPLPSVRRVLGPLSIVPLLLSACEPAPPEASSFELERRAHAAPPLHARRGERVTYGLAAHPEHLEVRRGAVREWPLGGIDSGKLGLGGFGSNVKSGTHDGRAVLFSKGRAARLRLPVDRAGRKELTILVKGFTRGRFGLRIDGEALEVKASRRADGWTLLRAETAEEIGAGEHELLVTTPPSAVVKGVGSTGAALAWLRVGPPGSLDDAEALSVGEHLFAEEGGPGLVLRPGVTIRAPFIVPKAAKLRARGSGPGELRASVLREGGRRDRLIEDRVAGELERSLARFEGETVYLELEALGGEVKLLAPRVVIPTAQSPKPKPPKNVLVFLIDTLRADKLSPVNPNSRVKTPGLERFVASAATFLAGHSQENWTKPSVATLFKS